MADRVDYIGGEFDQEAEKDFGSKSKPEFFPARIKQWNIQYYQTGSDAIAAIISELKKEETIKFLYFPKHYCWHSVELVKLKLKNSEIDIRSYSDLSQLKKLSEETVVVLLYLNKFTKKTQNELYRMRRVSGFKIIEDFVQCPLDISFAKGYAFNSLRKFCSIDLSIAYGKSYMNNAKEGNSQYISLRTKAKKLKSVYLKTLKPHLEKKYLELYKKADTALTINRPVGGNAAEIKRMKAIDLSAIKARRKQNYKVLAGVIRKIKTIRILEGDYMFLMVTTPKRDQLRKYLAEQMMFCPVHWPDSCDKFMKERSLSLPVDHRLNKSDMLRLGHAVQRFFINGN